MAFSSHSLVPLFYVVVPLVIVAGSVSANTGCYRSIYSVGDSITDTGNFLASLDGKPFHVANPPYGQAYFHRPTGRYCNGRIILDFIAEALGKPLVPPFLGGGSRAGDCRRDFGSGVNFAVGGATVLGNGFFGEKGMEVAWTNYSLDVQMEWFRRFRTSLCASRSPSDCNHLLSKSLFIVGEIGGNDYNYMFFQGRSLNETRAIVPKVIRAIGSAINDFIEFGARTLLVPADFPIGCLPVYLTIYQDRSNEDEYYDPKTGCINWLNEFAAYHNSMLSEELDRIRRRHPRATIIYADYYNAALSIYKSSNPFGFGAAPRAACCGGGGPYNYNASAMCGTETAKECSDPSRYISWDGIHFTEASYRAMAKGLLNGSFTAPPINHVCPHLEPISMDQAQEAL